VDGRNSRTVYEVSGSYSSEDISVGVLGSNTQKMEAVCSSKTLLSTYKSTWYSITTQETNIQERNTEISGKQNVWGRNLLQISDIPDTVRITTDAGCQ
jgi:hypothetical protein